MSEYVECDERDLIYEIDQKVKKKAKKRKEESDVILETVYEMLFGKKPKDMIYVVDEEES